MGCTHWQLANASTEVISLWTADKGRKLAGILRRNTKVPPGKRRLVGSIHGLWSLIISLARGLQLMRIAIGKRGIL